MLDIDLSTLGRDDARFDRFERDVRTDSEWVPTALFRPQRREMLVQFLDRPFLLVTERFRRRYESQPRANLARSVENLA